MERRTYGYDEIMIERFHKAALIDGGDDLFLNRVLHLKQACKEAKIEGTVFEFGVHNANTVHIIADCFPNSNVYGFDSFEGLPEDWNVSYKEKFNKHKKGYFALDKLPEIYNDNIQLVKGFFNKSLPTWIANNEILQCKFIHIDSDLGSSATTVLENLNPYIVKGTVIVFDEFYPWGRKRYERWAEHEYKSLVDWSEKYSREFDVLYRNNHQQCSIEITK